MLPRGRNVRGIVGSVVVATALGLAGVMALLLPEGTLPSHVSVPTIPHLATSMSPTAMPSPVSSTVAVPNATAGPMTTTTPAVPVALSVTSIEPQTNGDGVIVTIDVANHLSRPLSFDFDPARDVEVHDSHGSSWGIRWAEYRGAPTFAVGETARLVRGLFVSGGSTAVAWPLTILVHHVPGAGGAQWSVSQNDRFPAVATQIPPRPPPTVAPGPVSVAAIDPLPSTELGGVQVDLDLHNQQASELLMRFDPNAQIAATDNLGRPYQVRWAQYGGIVRVPARGSSHLARIFLSGPIDTGHPSWVHVVVSQVPGGGSISTNVPVD